MHTHITICHVNGCFAKATDDSARPPSLHPRHVCQPTWKACLPSGCVPPPPSLSPSLYQGPSCSCSLLPFCLMSESIASSSDSQPQRISAAIVMRTAMAHFPLGPHALSSPRSRRERRNFRVIMTSLQLQLSLQKWSSHKGGGRGGWGPALWQLGRLLATNRLK